MEENAYTAVKPRESDPSSGRHFAFYRVRGSAATRFLPGDGARLKYVNRDADTLEIPGVPAEFLLRGDKVRVTYKGECVFLGDVVSRTEHKSRGTDATQSVVCAGPWSKMARLVYRQYWNTKDGLKLSSRLILNQTQTGLDQALNAELREIATHGADACGYTVGTISVSNQQLPYDECRDITVADAIRRELKLFPSAICRFDYSATTPALQIVKPDASSDASYVADIPKTQRSYEYNAHPITGVDLEIESTGDVDGVPYRVLEHQTAGDTAYGNPDCLYATLQLAGFSSSSVRQSFTAVVETNVDYKNPGWWYYRHPRLANVSADAVSITNCQRSGAGDAGNYPNIAKQSVGELKAAGLKARVESFTCDCTITTENDIEEKIHLQMQYVTTNAQSKTYTWIASSSSTTGETAPAGLAAAILAERSGELRAERMTVRCGDSLPRIGDACDGLTLQQIEIDCGSLTADLQFGAPEFLSVDDMASLLSNFRNKRRTTLSTSRVEGKPNDGAAEVEMGPIPPLSSTEFAPGTKAKTTIASSSGGTGGTIKLDSSGLESDETIDVKTLTVKGEAEEQDKSYKILASDDIEIPAGGGVASVNGLTGALTISAGEGISISASGDTITITNTKPCNCEEGEEDGSGPSDPCSHPESEEEGGSDESGGTPGEAGGVLAPENSSEGGVGGWSQYGGDNPDWYVTGGVGGGGDSHSGSNDCCTE